MSSLSQSTGNPNLSDIYAGLAGVELPVDQFEFGQGVLLKKTYAHVMAPYLAAFAPAEPGKPHPAPWKAVSGGFAFDIKAELHIPIDFNPKEWFDRLNTAWWLLALIRLRGTSLASIPVIANAPFARIPEMNEEPRFWTLEMEPRPIILEDRPPTTLDLSSLDWVRKYWLSAGSLMRVNDEFNVAFQAADQCTWSRSPSLGLVTVWGALERLFSYNNQELTFRVSATIASFLEPPGESRLALYQSVKKLYDARSKAAHGAGQQDVEAFADSYALLRRALRKIIEQNRVPNRDELEGLLFGRESTS